MSVFLTGLKKQRGLSLLGYCDVTPESLNIIVTPIVLWVFICSTLTRDVVDY